uniref:Uncharacterized protein n=1 Tax=Nelumbo nucifera TaxID=4432 RepID=A0A822YWL1_NELNU|nr:TPA_asm: hypothetical protein HUJ06_007194 [Nelumbo nucifera]
MAGTRPTHPWLLFTLTEPVLAQVVGCTTSHDTLKSLADALAASNYHIPDSDIIHYLLGGLPFEHGIVVISITTRLDKLSLPDVQSLLLTYEKRLTRHHTSLDGTSANIANRKKHNSPHPSFDKERKKY